MVEPVVEIRVVAPVLHQTASMSDGGAIALEKVTDLGQTHPAADMGEIHRHLSRERGSRRAPRPAAQIFDTDTAATANSIAHLTREVPTRTPAR